MKILYGVQGTGNGHITRARAMAAELQSLPVAVDFLFSGRDPGKFFEMDPFGPYRVCDGLTFVTREGRIRPLRTALHNRPLRYLNDLRTLELNDYDLILTDFEPVTAWAGRLRGKKVVGIGHQYAFHSSIPQHHGNPAQHLIIRHFAPARLTLGLHWHHFGQPILPPIAPVKPGSDGPERGRYVVYLPFESPAEILRLLRPFDDFRFQIYHPEVAPAEEGHLSWHQPGRRSFQDDLHRSEGVLCNAGFELASEVLQLGRKLLVKPVAGQAEQYSNALALKLLGYGHVMYRLDEAKVGAWLESARATRIQYPNVAAAICRWILEGADGGQIPELASSLWRQTLLPDIPPGTCTDNGCLQSCVANH